MVGKEVRCSCGTSFRVLGLKPDCAGGAGIPITATHLVSESARAPSSTTCPAARAAEDSTSTADRNLPFESAADSSPTSIGCIRGPRTDSETSSTQAFANGAASGNASVGLRRDRRSRGAVARPDRRSDPIIHCTSDPTFRMPLKVSGCWRLDRNCCPRATRPMRLAARPATGGTLLDRADRGALRTFGCTHQGKSLEWDRFPDQARDCRNERSCDRRRVCFQPGGPISIGTGDE